MRPSSCKPLALPGLFGDGDTRAEVTEVLKIHPRPAAIELVDVEHIGFLVEASRRRPSHFCQKKRTDLDAPLDFLSTLARIKNNKIR
jgi:hypothetical protein